MDKLNRVIGFYKLISGYRQLIWEGKAILTLSPSLLELLNNVLTALESDGIVDNLELTYEEKVELYELDSILKSCVLLKLNQRNVATFCGNIDLSRFVKLRKIEFHKVSLETVYVHEESVSSGVTDLVSFRCVHVQDLLKPNIWNNLKNVSITYCNITSLDESALKNISLVTSLNLCFNKLRNVDGLKCLEKLAVLNLSFNFLERIPEFSDSVSSTLKKLYIDHNILLHLNGIHQLANLECLYASNNCIFNVNALIGLSSLKKLHLLSLIGNPLSLHQRYRMYVVHFLGTTVPPFEFVLDDKHLRDAELDFMGTYRGPVTPTTRPSLSLPTSADTLLYTDPPRRESYQPIFEVHTEDEVILAPSSILKSSKQKAKKTRDVEIGDSDRLTPRQKHKPSGKQVVFADSAPDEGSSLLEATEGNFPSGDKPILGVLTEETPSIEPFDTDQLDPYTKVEESSVGKGSEGWLVSSSPELCDSRSCTVEVTVHASHDSLGDTPPVQLYPSSVSPLQSSTRETLSPLLSSSSPTQDSRPPTLITSTPHQPSSNSTLQERSGVGGKHAEPMSPDPDSTLDLDAVLDEGFLSFNQEFVSSTLLETPEESCNEFASCTSESHNTVKVDSSATTDDSSPEDFNCDENLWPVKKVMDSKVTNIFLVLLDTELRERSTISGRTTATYPLVFLQGFFLLSDDPITVQIEFISLLSIKITRTYIMEFPDYQALVNKMTAVLESRCSKQSGPSIRYIQAKHQCKACLVEFIIHKTTASVAFDDLSCPLCKKDSLVEVVDPVAEEIPLSSEVGEEPCEVDAVIHRSDIVGESEQASPVVSSPPSEDNPLTLSSPSSIATASLATSNNISTASQSPHNMKSGVSSEPSERYHKGEALLVNNRYESDVEIISNPSQSSIEVLDDPSRTPSRRTSREEKGVESVGEAEGGSEESGVLPAEVEERQPRQPPVTLSDSTSSGSACESVVTSYEANGGQSGMRDLSRGEESDQNVCLVEESDRNTSGYDTRESHLASSECLAEGDSSLSSSHHSTPLQPDTLTDHSVSNSQHCNYPPENITKEETTTDIYSFSNFSDVDYRIKVFLYQYIFNDDSEELALCVKCHLWKTGGSDYSGCFVLSTSKVYLFMQTSTVYGLDASDWLKLQDSHDVKSIKQMFTLVWNQGVGVQINQINYFILLNNKLHTDNLLAAIKGLNVGSFDVVTKPSNKVEMSLQQIVLSCNYVNNVVDPSVLLFTLCTKINIIKDEEVQETMRLSGFVVTGAEFYIVLGDLGWLAGNSQPPSIHFYQLLSSLIGIGRRGLCLSLHFLAETDAVEEVWSLQCCNEEQVSTIIETMKAPWQNMFSVPLEVSQ